MAPQVNGEVHPASATLSHITGYPVINDSISYFKKNPYGQKSIALGDSAYQTLAKQVLPYLNKPYQYVSPYVKKADAMGDDTLSKIDQRLPVLKKPTDELFTDGRNIVFFPVRKGLETKDHFFDVYHAELKKVGGDGVVTAGKALLFTGLVVTAEAWQWVGDMLRAGKAQTKETSEEVAQQVNH
ncbi:hypothetical protein GGR57DRAFT_110668 [Xylariaceae sp. FL1272]|nr:hypothetical protein GGR57DRAFT_110668 [Xylariaceae sp. FL1272]